MPNFLIIGAPRGGTTWIAKNLMEHPDVYMPLCKEVHFFDRSYDKGMDHYASFFAEAENKIAVGEATPEYLYVPEVASRIYKELPNAKLIVSLRNPVERLYSRYWHAKARYPENANISFEDKIRQKPVMIEEGFYFDHLMRYYNLFPRTQILVLLYDDLEKSPHDFLRSIFSFLGIDEGFMSSYLDLKINSAASKKYVGKSQFLWNLYRVLMRLRFFSVAKVIESLNRNEYPPMKVETKKWLVNEVYGEKNRLLQSLIGRDLSAWSRID